RHVTSLPEISLACRSCRRHIRRRDPPAHHIRVMPGLSSLSLERKLPLLISVLLVALAGGLTVAGYHEVRQTSELRAIDRLRRLTSQLAELASVTQQQRYGSPPPVAAG